MHACISIHIFVDSKQVVVLSVSRLTVLLHFDLFQIRNEITVLGDKINSTKDRLNSLASRVDTLMQKVRLPRFTTYKTLVAYYLIVVYKVKLCQNMMQYTIRLPRKSSRNGI